MGSANIRNATADDYHTFARLFRELGAEDPVPTAERFATDFLPTTLIAEHGGLPSAGYAFFRPLTGVVHLTHLVTAPDARRRGIGRALMAEVAQRARANGCTTMQLNVHPTNTAAIRLYESIGLDRVHENRGLKIAWSIVDGLAPDAVALAPLARPVEPEDDERLEAEWEMPKGVLAEQRVRPNRVLRSLASAFGRNAVAVFDLGFPGAYPFRAPDLLSALSLLRALRPLAAGDAVVFIALENQPDLSEALMKVGATLHMETVFMRGPLP